MSEVLLLISQISFVVAGACFLLTVFLWFKFGIPKIIGDLSGYTARRSIAKMRENNEKTGNKSFRPSAVNVARGKLTDTMVGSDRIKKSDFKEPIIDTLPETGILDENKAELIETDETMALDNDDTTVLLAEDDSDTERLDNVNRQKGGVSLEMLTDIMLIHTEEVIR